MKRTFFTILLLAAVTILYGYATFPTAPTAESSGGNIIIRWQTGVEVNVKHFVIERKSVNNDDFIEIATVNTRQDQNYEYIDENVFKSNDQLYTYRIKIVNNDGSQPTYSNDIQVVHSTTTTVKRTWGSIKALFR
ncbi:MAG: hypothetical protein JW995_07630 [Melioribacteraceae bacterium]|nr:hypothetical protein [Melioribacteraceae bacterium]